MNQQRALPKPLPDASAKSSLERARIKKSLRRIDRRRRWRRVFLRLGPALLAVGGLLLLLRVFTQQPQLLAPLAVAGGALLVVGTFAWGRSTDWMAAAELADREAQHPDLLRSAWSLGDSSSPPATRPRAEVDPAWLALIEQRAAQAADQIDPRRLIGYRMPNSGFAGLGLVAVWGALALFPGAREHSLLSLFDQRSKTEEPATEDQGAEETVDEMVQPMLGLGELPLVPMPVELLRSLLGDLGNLGSLDSETLAKLLREAGLLDPNSAALLSEEALASSLEQFENMSEEERAAAAALAERLSELTKGSDLLKELGREMEAGAAPQPGDDNSRASGDSAAAGEQQAQAGTQQGEADPNAPVQAANAPPKPDGSGGGQAAQTDAPALAAAAGQTGETEGAEGGSPMHNPFGPSGGGQDGPTDPFGEATELEVTLELAILEQQEKEASPTPERVRRASPRKVAEVGHRAARAGARTESEDGTRPKPVPWHYRDLVRSFFAPEAPQP